MSNQLITTQQALDALDTIDDCALMPISVNSYGPRHILTNYISQQHAQNYVRDQALAGYVPITDSWGESLKRIGDLEAVLRTIANSGWTVEKTREFAQRWLDKQ